MNRDTIRTIMNAGYNHGLDVELDSLRSAIHFRGTQDSEDIRAILEEFGGSTILDDLVFYDLCREGQHDVIVSQARRELM